jgi:hypothetical protein
MTTAISPIKRQQTQPYLTLTEFKNAPTALDYGNLVVGGNQAAQDAELSNAILRASSWIDQYCNQIIGATNDVEQQRVRLRPDGFIAIHPKYFPVVALTALSVGTSPQNLVAVPDCSIAWLEDQQILFPYAQTATTMSSQGPLSFGFPASPQTKMFVQYSYVNGYSNSTISTIASSGSSVLLLADGTGIVPGETITIFDGANTERVTVASSYTFDSNAVPLTAPLAYTHAVGISVSALPAAIKEAAILLTSAFLKIRGDASLTMGFGSTVSGQVSPSSVFGNDIAVAETLLKPFRRIY